MCISFLGIFCPNFGKIRQIIKGLYLSLKKKNVIYVQVKCLNSFLSVCNFLYFYFNRKAKAPTIIQKIIQIFSIYFQILCVITKHMLLSFKKISGLKNMLFSHVFPHTFTGYFFRILGFIKKILCISDKKIYC